MRNKNRQKTRFHYNVHVKVNGSIKAGMSICDHIRRLRKISKTTHEFEYFPYVDFLLQPLILLVTETKFWFLVKRTQMK